MRLESGLLIPPLLLLVLMFWTISPPAVGSLKFRSADIALADMHYFSHIPHLFSLSFCTDPQNP